MEDKKSRLKKTIINLIIFVALIALTFFFIFKDQDFSKILEISFNSKFQYVLIGLGAMFIYFSAEAINIGRTLKALGAKSNFLRNLKYTLIGFFFSAITPAATGGQPVEAYYMYRDKISLSHSSLALLIQLCSFQFVTISFGIISAIFNFDLLQSGLIYLLIFGTAVNFIGLVFFVIVIFCPKLSEVVIKLLIKFLKFIKVKNLDEKRQKFSEGLSSYKESAEYIKKNKVLVLKSILTTIVQILFYYSIPYWIYRALGFNDFSLLQIISIQAVLYSTVSGIPLPGSVGVSEGCFFGIFKNVFPEAIISSAMLLSRGVSFYFPIIISSIVVLIASVVDGKSPPDTMEQIELKEEVS